MSSASASAEAPLIRDTAEAASLDRLGDYLRETIIGCIQERAARLGPGSTQRGDSLTRNLRSLHRRVDRVVAIGKAFLIQADPDVAPSNEDAELALEEYAKAIEALFAIEVEARAAQTRIAGSASVLEYTGSQRSSQRQVTFRLDPFVYDRFKQLCSRVRGERLQRFGHSPVLSPEELLNLLVSIGECNVPTLALMGVPDAPGVRNAREILEGQGA